MKLYLNDILRGESQETRDNVILEIVEAALKRGNIASAIEELKRMKDDYYIFLGVRITVRKIIETIKGLISKFGEVPKTNKEIFINYLRDLIVLANSVMKERLRALLFADIAIAFYLLDESLEGDLALKTSLDLAEELKDDDVTLDIVYSLMEINLLEKAAYAMNLVRNRKKLDVILSHLALQLYKEGREENAARVIENIQSEFHKVMAIYKIAEFEAKRDKNKALELLKKAEEVVDKIDNPPLRFEAFVKLTELQDELMGKSKPL
ncbi:hypothetical protein E3E31_03320 [Thermococcus sp. M39]|uniref:hypothetical protein n=1 Tax=unclassified Thermococcus TaxID=2627626 RepID=UPI00143BF012|nr:MULTISPECIES: hypothetical protein [unclassified Thermococcus]NJE07562.1 hypothetical protein [Thermococcus sp. M39]NJE12146.1 hypothetical protein [Thermococcus sp. LS2]